MRYSGQPESIGMSNLSAVVERCGQLTADRNVTLNGVAISQLRFTADNFEFGVIWSTDDQTREVHAPLFDDPDPMLFWGERSITLRCWSESVGQYCDWEFVWT